MLRHLRTNKEIYRCWLAITSDCILRCKYCFLEKRPGVMKYTIAKRAIDFFITSPGRQKLLYFYGGEPLMYFGLLRRLILYAQKKSLKSNKKLTISIGTNGILLKQQYLDFFKQNHVRMALSIDGDMDTHDSNRIFKDGKGSFSALAGKIGLIKRILPKRYVYISCCVHPNNAHKIFDNFIYLTKLGFRNFSIEPICVTAVWDGDKTSLFLANFRKIVKFLYEEAKNNNFFFLSSINRVFNSYLKKKNISNCPFARRLEIWPSGNIYFSPFVVNFNHSSGRYAVGNIKNGILDIYEKCVFNFNNDRCIYCKKKYYREYARHILTGGPTELREEISKEAAECFIRASFKNRIFKDYISQAKFYGL